MHYEKTAYIQKIVINWREQSNKSSTGKALKLSGRVYGQKLNILNIVLQAIVWNIYTACKSLAVSFQNTYLWTCRNVGRPSRLLS